MFGNANIADKLWTEKYRPKSMDDYVFKNPALKAKVREWISKGELPNLLLSGPAGTGKSSLINVLLNEIKEVDEDDVMYLNMSEAGMDDIRDKVLPFVQTISFGSYKVVVLEEFEMCSHKGQGSLKRIMEDYSDVARFILTSNVPNKILPPIRSRCQEVTIEKHDTDMFTTRILNILLNEGVDMSDDSALSIVDKYVRATWPDFRKCINVLQSQVVDGKLLELNDSAANTSSFEFQLLDALSTNTLTSVRKQIVQNVTEDMVSEFYSWNYRNIDAWIPKDLSGEKRSEMEMHLIVKVRDGMVKDTLCADRELAMSAFLIEMQMIQLEYI